MIIVGLDVGTTTISGVLVEADSMAMMETLTLPNNAHLRTANTWENAQDPENIWQTCQIILEQFKRKRTKIDGIGLTGQMHGIVYMDTEGKAVGKLATWQDARGDEPYLDGTTYAEYLTKTLGYPMATGFGLTTHFYNLKNGLAPEKATSFCTIADYIAMRLCGRKTPLVHASNAASLGAFDLKKMQFNQDALEKEGIEPSLLPKVATGEVIIGKTADGVPVCTAIGDNQASFLGSVGTVDGESNLLVNIGTSSQISLKSNRILSDSALETRPFVNGEYLLVGAGLCGGSAYALLRDLFKEVLGLYGIDETDDLYAKMEEAAKAVTGKDDELAVDTRFRGTRLDPAIRGSIGNIGVDNLSVGQLALGALQGICDELYGFYAEVPAELKGAKYLAGSGNAIRKNATLRHLLADTFGMDVRIPQYEEEAALGVARVVKIIAGKGKNGS